MTDDTNSGPDLVKGVAASELADGAMLTGRIGEEPVLLIRRGEEFTAIDAFCTHYHAPLAEGALIGDTIRCPWHHACFDLKTGSPEHGPAMRTLKVYDVVREGDLVRALPAPVSPPARARVGGNEHVVIVGAGAAGTQAASELRRIGFEGRVTLLTRESQLPYDKPNLSKDYLVGSAPKEWIPLLTAEEYEANRIEVRRDVLVENIDASRREVVLGSGEQVAFDRLILATGSSPRQLDIPIDPMARVHYLRTWSDADSLLEAAAGARNAVVIGASFIGLEAAASLRQLGLNVAVVGSEEHPLEKVFGREIGEFIRRTHEEHGVRFRLGHRPAEIRSRAVILDDGSVGAADLIVVGIGAVPELGLAERAGLAVDRGIVVNDRLETSTPGIFAAGDAVRFPDSRSGRAIRVEHWAAAGRQGQTAARNAAGLDEPFTAVPFFWSQHYDLVFNYVGHAALTSDVEMFGSLEDRNAAAVMRDDGRIAAVVTLFRDDVSLAVEAAMERGEDDATLLDRIRRAF